MATRRSASEHAAAAFADVLADARISLVVPTSTGEVLVLRADRCQLAVDRRSLVGATGIGVAPGWLALGTNDGIWELREEPGVVGGPGVRGLDAVYVPRRFHPTGGPVVDPFHGAEGVTWFVDVGRSCLATAEAGTGIVTHWRSPLAPASLTGVAASAGVARYVTAVGPAAVGGGSVIEVDSGELVAAGLDRPSSPRLHDSRLWLLDRHSLAIVDRASGELTAVAGLAGSAHGLAFAGSLAFVGLSGDAAGVAVVDLGTGLLRTCLELPGVAEVLDVQVVPHRSPAIDVPTTTPHPHLDRSTP